MENEIFEKIKLEGEFKQYVYTYILDIYNDNSGLTEWTNKDIITMLEDYLNFDNVLPYTKDRIELFDKHEKEIEEIFFSFLDETGENIGDYFKTDKITSFSDIKEFFVAFAWENTIWEMIRIIEYSEEA